MSESVPPFETLYRLYYRRMAAYLAGFSAIPRSERADLAHDILVHAWLKRDRYRPRTGGDRSGEQKLNAWVYALARNYIVDRIRERRASAIPFSDGHDADRAASGRTPEEETLASGVMQGIRDALSRMSGRDREIAQLVFYERMSAAETGRILGIPGATVRWRLAAIRKKLARIVEEAS
jgi:RNA polymerase sigma-70 factor (ECF subfamily)